MKSNTFIIYSLIAMPLAIIGLPLYIYLPTFYATQIDIATVGLILFIARITDVFTDPYIGYISDKCLNRFNSRKPIMFIGFFLLIISFYALINPSTYNTTIWLLLFSVFIYLGWSLVTIPYLTWSSEITTDYYAKTKLNTFREFATILGLVLALVLPVFISDNIIKDKLDSLFIIFLTLFIPLFFITIFTLKIKNKQTQEIYSLKDIKEIYKKIPQLKNLHIGYFFNNLANAIPATLFLLFIELVIQQKNSSDLVLILYFISGIIALPIWTLISKRIGKKRVWIYSIVLSCSAFFFVLFLGKDDLILFGIISFITGLCLGSDIAFPTSIQADIIQKEKDSKKDYSGLLFGIWTMLTKLALATSVGIAFGILGLVGFDKENLNTQALITLSLLYGLVPILLKFIALFFINKYKDEID